MRFGKLHAKTKVEWLRTSFAARAGTRSSKEEASLNLNPDPPPPPPSVVS